MFRKGVPARAQERGPPPHNSMEIIKPRVIKTYGTRRSDPPSNYEGLRRKMNCCGIKLASTFIRRFNPFLINSQQLGISCDEEFLPDDCVSSGPPNRILRGATNFWKCNDRFPAESPIVGTPRLLKNIDGVPHFRGPCFWRHIDGTSSE